MNQQVGVMEQSWFTAELGPQRYLAIFFSCISGQNDSHFTQQFYFNFILKYLSYQFYLYSQLMICCFFTSLRKLKPSGDTVYLPINSSESALILSPFPLGTQEEMSFLLLKIILFVLWFPFSSPPLGPHSVDLSCLLCYKSLSICSFVYSLTN